MKKLTVNRLAFSNLKARKKQYTLMIIGIVLAMIFSSGIIFFVSCMSTSLTELTYSGYGCQDVIYGRITDVDALNGAVDGNLFEDYGTANVLGFAYVDDKESRGFSVATYDDKALEMSRQSITDGRMPEKAGEIAVEADALLRLRIKAAVGDTLTFKFKVQNDDKYLDKETEKTYTLVGILKDKRSNIQYYNGGTGASNIPAAIVSNEEVVEAGGKARLCAYVTYVNKDRKGEYWKKINDYSEAHEFSDYSFTEYTECGSYWNLGGGEIETKTVLAGVLAAVLTAASCVGIVNSFNTNLQERKKQIGLLRAVGTTRRQIIRVFGREAFIIAVISAPISVAVSYFLSKLIIHFMGENMVFAPKLWILGAGAVLSIAVVMAASLIPLSVASRISPMQAIRNIDITRKMKNKKVKTKKSFVVSKLLARRDMAFSRGKTVAVCLMLVISFLLGSFGISFMKFMFDTNGYSLEKEDYSLYLDFWNEYTDFSITAGPEGYGIPNAAVNEVLMLPYVESVLCRYSVNATLMLEKEYKILDALANGYSAYDLEGRNACPELTAENYRDFIKEQESSRLQTMTGEGYIAYMSYSEKPVTEAKQKFNIRDPYFNTDLNTFSEEELRSLEKDVIDGKIDIDKINSGEEVILCIPEKVGLTVRASNEDWDGTDRTFVAFDTSENFNPDGTLKYTDKNTTLLEVVDNDVKAGDTLEISMVFDKYPGTEGIDFSGDIYSPEAKQYRKTVKIGAVVKPGANFCCSGQVYTSNAGYAAFGAPDRIIRADVFLNCDCTDSVDAAVSGTLDELSSGGVFSYNSTYAMAGEMETEKRTIIVGFASVLILFFSVCASLINNSMTAKIREDKRQIGTLRAVGATSGELTKAYILRLLRIFAIGFIGGLISYLVFHFGLYFVLKVTEKLDEEGFLSFLVWPSLVICALIFAVCAFNLWRQVRKQMKYSIVENIREL